MMLLSDTELNCVTYSLMLSTYAGVKWDFWLTIKLCLLPASASLNYFFEIEIKEDLEV